jgi:hypothetical protein
MAVTNPPQDDVDEGEELIASEVDELTHAELLCLYRDLEENIRFSKLLQWRGTAGTLVVLVLFMLFAEQYGKKSDMIKILTILTFMVGSVSISMLVIFQSWQGTEREKLKLILGNLSSLARDIYNTKSKLMANVERYILLGFMCCAILTGGFLTLARLLRWFSS